MQKTRAFQKPDTRRNRNTPGILVSIAVLFLCQSAYGAGLAVYRQFQFGMSAPEVSKLIGLEPARIVTVHQRPAIIEELEWVPYLYAASASDLDPVRDIVFHFVDGKLYRMVVHYDPHKTEGMTSADLIESISKDYGPPSSLPPHTTMPLADGDSADVVARWQDQQFSFSLVRTGYSGDFGLVAIANALDHNADLATKEAMRLDEQERPAREIQKEKDLSLAKEKVRPINKANFRP